MNKSGIAMKAHVLDGAAGRLTSQRRWQLVDSGNHCLH
jgi:hypothetical protein